MRQITFCLLVTLIFSCGCASITKEAKSTVTPSQSTAPNAYSNYKSAAELAISVDRGTYYALTEVLNRGWTKENKELEKLLSDNEPALEEIQRGLEKDICILPVATNPEEQRAILFSLDRFKELARLLILKIQFQVYKKDYNKAVQYCFDLIKFGQHLENGGNSLSKRIGMVIESSGYKNLRNIVLIQDNRLNYAHVLETIQGFRNNIQTREHFKETLTKELPTIKFNISPLLLTGKDWHQFKQSYEATGYTREDILKSIRVCYIDAERYIELPYNEGLKIWHLEENPQNPVRYKLIPILKNIYIECGRLDIERDATFIITGLEYYHKKNNRYPEKLSDLVPKYLLFLPSDSFSGESFVYQRRGKGWRMYSIGSDLINDFGQKYSYLSQDGTGDIIFSKE